MATPLTHGAVSIVLTGTIANGTFVDGSPWFVGPADVESQGTAPTGTVTSRRNGAMINPSQVSLQGYDGRMNAGAAYQSYSAGLDVSLSYPLTVNPGQTLVVALSSTPLETNIAAIESCISDYGFFTCLAAAPPANSFRPPYMGGWKPLFNVSDLNMSYCAQIARASDPLTGSGLFPTGGTATHAWLNIPMYQMMMPSSFAWDKNSPVHTQFHYPSYNGLVINQIMSLMITVGAQSTESYRKIAQLAIDNLGIATLSDSGWTLCGAGYQSPMFAPLCWGYLMFSDPRFLTAAHRRYVVPTVPSNAYTADDPDEMDVSIGSYWEKSSIWSSPGVPRVPSLPFPKAKSKYFMGLPYYGDPWENTGTWEAANAGSGSNYNQRSPDILLDATKHTAFRYNDMADPWPFTNVAWGAYVRDSVRGCLAQSAMLMLVGQEGLLPRAWRNFIRRWVNDPLLWQAQSQWDGLSDATRNFNADIYGFGSSGNLFVKNLIINNMPAETGDDLGIKKYKVISVGGAHTVLTSQGVRTF